MRAEGWSLWHHVSCHPIGIVRMCWMSLRSRRASLIRSDSLRVESSSGLDPSTWWVSEEDFCLILPEPQRKGWMDGWWMDDRAYHQHIGEYEVIKSTYSHKRWLIGVFSVSLLQMLSLLPQRILRLLEFIGFSGNRVSITTLKPN